MSQDPSSHPDEIKQRTEALSDFVQYIAEIVWSRNWSKLILLVDAILLFFANPPILQNIISIFGIDNLPSWYKGLFWLTIGGIFLAAVVVAVITTRPQAEAPPEEKERRVIKGLRAFDLEDAEVFKRLQRSRILAECLESFTSDNFRFGIIMAESGCGKTSFLRAGLWYALRDPESSHQGIYVKFTNREPLERIYTALREQLQIPTSKLQGVDFLTALQKAITKAGKPIILILDQFEQFYVHHKRKPAREPFINALREWYQQENPLPVKIIVSIRDDMAGQLTELQDALGYSLGPSDVFRLERFSPEEATEILRVMAESEDFQFDERFIKELTADELANREDGLVSPVDLQIFAWMVGRQNTDEVRDFDRTAFQKFGGVEGLLTRFLKEVLAARVTPSQRQAVVKVLVALTDLERNVRAGVLRLAELQEKLKDTLKPEEVTEATLWLTREDVRLVTPVTNEEGTKGYELAHERLIPALRNVIGEELSEVDKVNHLLERRVNEWLGNDRSDRYLLSLNDLWHIERQRAYLNWGSKRSQKEKLLQISKRDIYWNFGSMIAGILLSLCILIWWYSPYGLIQQARWDLVKYSPRVGDNYAEKAAVALAKDQKFEKSRKVTETISDGYSQTKALTAIAQVYEMLGYTQLAQELLAKNRQFATQLEDELLRAQVLLEIAQAYGVLGDSQSAQELLTESHKFATQLDKKRIQAQILPEIAQVYGALGDIQSAQELLIESRELATQLEEFFQEFVLAKVVQAYGALGYISLAQKPLTEVYKLATQLEDKSYQVLLLPDIAEVYGKFDNVLFAQRPLAEIYEFATQFEDEYYQALVLIGIAKAHSKLGNTQSAREIISESRQLDTLGRDGYDAHSRSRILTGMATVYEELGDVDSAQELLEESRQLAKAINYSQSKSEILNTIAQIQAESQNWGEIRPLLKICPSEDCRVDILATTLSAWAEQQNPALAGIGKEDEE